MNHKQLLTITLLLISPQIFPQERPMAITDNSTQDIPYITISAELFEKCLPWRDGKYITIDSWGNFATLEWSKDKKTKKDKLDVVPIVKFPSQRVSTTFFYAQPETGWIWTKSNMKFLGYNADTKLTCDFIPVPSFKSWIELVNSFSKYELLFSYETQEPITKCIKNYTYNSKTKHPEKMGEDSEILLWKQIEPFGKDFLAYEHFEYSKELDKYIYRYFLYNFDTKEKTENDLTKMLNKTLYEVDANIDVCISISSRDLVSKCYSLLEDCPVVITWKDNYEDPKLFPLNILAPKGKTLEIQTVSPDCKWIFTYICYYEGLHRESLCKVGFIKISEEYPGIASPLVILDEYAQKTYFNACSFIEHPEYGSCFICSYDNGNKKETRLYKMSDVQKEIDRILLEKAKSALSEGK